MHQPVVFNVELKIVHIYTPPNKSGRKSFLFTFLFVILSIVAHNDALGNFLPLMINESQVFVIPRLLANITLLPCGLFSK
jgi:hypothetical protein